MQFYDRVMERRHRVVVVGAGFGGLAVLRSLESVPVDLVMIERNNFHTFQPLLYQVATAGLDSDDIAYPLRGIASHRNAQTEVRMGSVRSVDLAAGIVHLDEGQPVEYDQLVLAAGAVSATFNIPGVEQHAFGLKTLEDALSLRSHVLRQFERATVDPSLIDSGGLTVVIAGGGPTGVEMAGGLVELFENVLSRDFPTLDIHRARVVIVEPGARLLASFRAKLGDLARRTLTSRGVEVALGVGVAATDGKVVELTDGTRIPAGTLVWTAGVRANPLAECIAEQLGADSLTRGGRIRVEDDLSVPGHPEVYVIGDLAGFSDTNGELLPQLAPVAIQQGEHVGALIKAQVSGGVVKDFRYRDKGSMATIGRHAAVAQLPGGLRLSGFPGWLAWLGLHLVMLIGFRNRVNVLVNWAWNYFTYDRASRLILESPSKEVHVSEDLSPVDRSSEDAGAEEGRGDPPVN